MVIFTGTLVKSENMVKKHCKRNDLSFFLKKTTEYVPMNSSCNALQK